MNERLQKILDSEKLTNAKFAEIIGIQRSSISHFLSGRNKPSFDVIQSILLKFPKISPDWLISGIGDMYRLSGSNIEKSVDVSAKSASRDLFSSITNDKKNLSGVESLPYSSTSKEENPMKKINLVVVFYEDNTFEEYHPKK